jgi:flavin reductase (DIM6/NTAB) family NADH-FMN oxidoreductase RutF/DNA-binding IclR family transcriptional regulator
MTTAAIDPRRLRDVLGTFVTGVTIVTTCDDGGRPHGVTANSFTSVSLDPPLVLWSQSITSRSHAAFAGSDSFAINILADDQVTLSNHFAVSRDDKFSQIDFSPGVGGSPVLHGTAASLECTKVATYPGGDHVVFLGRIERMQQSNRRPLVYGNGRYMVAYSYDLGPVSLQLGESTPQQIEALSIAIRGLPAISEGVGEHTACLGVWGNHGPTIVHWEPSRRPVSQHLRTGLVVSTTRSAVGRAFAAWLPHSVTKPFVEEDLRLFRAEDETPAQQQERFDAMLEEFRAKGMTRTVDANSALHQCATNAFCVPVFGAAGKVVMVIAITSQADRLLPDWDGEAPGVLAAAAHGISRQLGHAA